MAATTDLVPPFNFAMVCPGVYRGGHPTPRNGPFLKSLGLRTILYLCREPYQNSEFCETNGVRVVQCAMDGNKEPFVEIPAHSMDAALAVAADVRNHPLMVHCNKGKHRTGTVVMSLRMLQGWCLASAFDEYIRFAGDKARQGDQLFVELYHPRVPIHQRNIAPWVYRTDRIVAPDFDGLPPGAVDFVSVQSKADAEPQDVTAEEKRKKDKKQDPPASPSP